MARQNYAHCNPDKPLQTEKATNQPIVHGQKASKEDLDTQAEESSLLEDLQDKQN